MRERRAARAEGLVEAEILHRAASTTGQGPTKRAGVAHEIKFDDDRAANLRPLTPESSA
jgi:hypothetical protein